MDKCKITGLGHSSIDARENEHIVLIYPCLVSMVIGFNYSADREEKEG